MRRMQLSFVAALAAGGAWACTDTAPPLPTDLAPLESHMASCDLKLLDAAAKKYINQPAQRTAVTSRIRDLGSLGCTGEAAEKLAWEILRIVEQVFYGGTFKSGTEPDGATLVNGVLHCCIPLGGTVTVPTSSLGPAGTLAVRGMLPGADPAIDDVRPILARAAVPFRFTAEDGSQVVRPALFAARPRDEVSWSGVAFGDGVAGTFIDDVLLVHGSPTGPAPHLSYRFEEGPDQGFHPGTQVDVIACFTDAANAPPDPGGDGFVARMRRNQGLLQPAENVDAFCQQWVWGVSGASAAAAAPSRLGNLARQAVRLLVPRPLFAALQVAIGVPSSGGGAGNFSEFSILNADINGALTFLQGPPSVVPSTSAVFPLVVQARSGGGTPVEFVDVRLTIKQNQGAPAGIVGSFIGCDGVPTTSPVACTTEPDGLALFQVSISKAGGYIMCASGEEDDFFFPEICTPQFQVRN